MKRFALLVVLLFTVLPLFADSITFSTFVYQDNPFRLVDLGPSLDPLLVPQVADGLQILSFGTATGPIGTVVFSSTLTLPGFGSEVGPATVQCDFATLCILVYGFQVPISYKVTAGTLSVTLNGVTETDNFRYAVLAPEPTSLLLLGTGLAGIAWRKYKRRKG
jgi:PEP-CTERM motif